MARFLRGQSGNPGGRPKSTGKARQIAREHTAHAVFALVRISCDLNATPRLQFEAARELIRMGFGRLDLATEERCSTEGGIGRFPALRTRIEDLVSELDQQHRHYRRVLRLELEELERSEGLTRKQDLPP